MSLKSKSDGATGCDKISYKKGRIHPKLSYLYKGYETNEAYKKPEFTRTEKSVKCTNSMAAFLLANTCKQNLAMRTSREYTCKQNLTMSISTLTNQLYNSKC